MDSRGHEEEENIKERRKKNLKREHEKKTNKYKTVFDICTLTERNVV